MEEVKQFTKSTKRKFEELEMALLRFSRKAVQIIVNYPLHLELLKNPVLKKYWQKKMRS